MCQTTPSDPDEFTIHDQLEFIETKLHRLLQRCRMLETLSDPRGLENQHSRVIELDRMHLALIFEELAEDIDIAHASAREIIPALRHVLA